MESFPQNTQNNDNKLPDPAQEVSIEVPPFVPKISPEGKEYIWEIGGAYYGGEYPNPPADPNLPSPPEENNMVI